MITNRTIRFFRNNFIFLLFFFFITNTLTAQVVVVHQNKAISQYSAQKLSENILGIVLSNHENLNMVFLTNNGNLKLRNILISAVLLLLVISIFSSYHFYKLKKESNKVSNLKKELDARNDEYERVFNSLQDVYYRSDINGIVVSISPSVFALSGYRASDVIGRHERSFYNDISLWEPFRKDLISKGAVNDRFLMMKNAMSKPIAISVTAKVIYDSNNNIIGFEGVLRDISSKFASENKLKASEQKLRLATEISKLGISEYNPQSEVIDINDVLSRFIFDNSTPAQITLSQLSALIHPEDFPHLVKGYNDIIIGSISEFELEFRIAGAGGKFLWFNSKFVKLVADEELDNDIILGIHLYIDDLKTALISVSQNQRILEAIYNSVQTMLIVADKKLNIREVNDMVSVETGMLKDQLIDHSLNCLYSETYDKTNNSSLLSVNELESIVLESIEKREGVYNREISFRLVGSSSDLEKRFFNVSTTVFFVDDDLRVLVSIDDITDQKKYEYESERTRTLIEENSKLKSDFISNLSFEIRTPINAIMGFVSLLKSKSVSAEQKEKYVEIIRESSDKLLGIVENVIELSKAEFHELDIRKTEFNIVTLIKNIGESYSDKIQEKNLELIIKTDVDDEKAIFDTDLQKISTVMGHLLENSIKYTKAGNITLGIYDEDDRMCLFVSDTGVGIEKPEMLFTDSSENTKEHLDYTIRDHGMGISLRICKAYIEALGGELFVESTTNIGSKFSFYLPYDEKITETLIEKNETIFKAKILIVEDADYNYEYLSQILELEGYDYIIADDGQKAIDAVKENPDIDLILMDIRLPRINGLEASKIIKSFRPDIPIIAQTAYDFNSEEEKQIEEYCVDYIQKPIVSKILINKIEKILE